MRFLSRLDFRTELPGSMERLSVADIRLYVLVAQRPDVGWSARVLAKHARRNSLMRLIASMAILALSALPALADRQVTEDERAKLSAAVQAEGCSGGKFEMDEDDQQFEVDDAVCADGKKYDLKFDMQMRLKRKNLD